MEADIEKLEIRRLAVRRHKLVVVDNGQFFPVEPVINRTSKLAEMAPDPITVDVLAFQVKDRAEGFIWVYQPRLLDEGAVNHQFHHGNTIPIRYGVELRDISRTQLRGLDVKMYSDGRAYLGNIKASYLPSDFNKGRPVVSPLIEEWKVEGGRFGTPYFPVGLNRRFSAIPYALRGAQFGITFK